MLNVSQKFKIIMILEQVFEHVKFYVNSSSFNQYVLGTLFYRFISENLCTFMKAEADIDYPNISDDEITNDIKGHVIQAKGFFIYPSQLFQNIAKDANTNDNLNTDLKKIFDDIESSADGYPSALKIKGLFANFDTQSINLGSTVKEKNSILAIFLKGIEKINFGNFEGNQIDLFGDAYEFLISLLSANAGKSGGEYFTPQPVSKLIAKIAVYEQKTINKIYDPTCGSGSLLLQAQKLLGKDSIENGFFGQEINYTTYNLARMNMFLHNVNYNKFNISLGDTLTEPQFIDDKPFDAIVSNPPYSVKWIGKDDKSLVNDERFSPAGVLAPKSKADFAFIMHSLNYLSTKGRAVIVCFPGIFYRGGTEQKFRKYLVDNNYIETIISLPSNLFSYTSISVDILVLSKHKETTEIQFINASGEDFYITERKNNLLTDEHVEKIFQIFKNKKDVDYIAKSITVEQIQSEDYNLSVNTYVEMEDTTEKIDIEN